MSHFTIRTGDRVKAEQDLMVSIRKATNIDEIAPKRKHVRSRYIAINECFLISNMHAISNSILFL